MSTTTLLIGYYHGLLLRSIDADMLTDKMFSVGLLTAHEQNIISSGNSIYQKNQLLLYHVQHMNVQALLTFCELVQDLWPQIGSQLITGTYMYVLFSYNEEIYYTCIKPQHSRLLYRYPYQLHIFRFNNYSMYE